MADRFRFGIMGTGNIAGQFAEGLAGSRHCAIAAVGSRRADTARDFARRYGIGVTHASYQALLADPEVEAIYLSLPNALHHEWTLKALAAGKHVLCEKPLAGNARQAQEMFAAARAAGRLLVEAFMYRSHPLTQAYLDQIDAGAIGQVRLVRASFCYCTSKVAGNIRFDPGLEGGALMDIGCYCVHLARLVAGAEPSAVHAVAHRHALGVEDIVVGTLTFPASPRAPGGMLASFTCGMSVHADNTAWICGSEGYIAVPVPWKPPPRQAEFVIARSAPPRQEVGAQTGPPPLQSVRVDAPAPLYGLEADDFAAAVRHGAAPRLSEADTLGNMRVLDQLRAMV